MEQWILYLQCIAMFILGQVLHLMWIKIPSMKAKARAANKAYYFKEFWSCDWNVIIGTQVLLASLLFGLGELLVWKPDIINHIKWTFWTVGAFASSVGMAKFSQYEKSLMQTLDIKSNIADHFTGGTTTVADTIKKGEEATGIDVTKHDIIK